MNTATPKRLRILVIDEDAQRGETLAAVLRVTGYDAVVQAAGAAYLPNLVADAQPDLVLIDLDSPDRDTLEQLSVMHRETPRPVVMFAQDDDEHTIQSAVRAGVSAYVVDGMGLSKVKPVIDVAIAHFRQHQSMRDELDRTKTSLEERKFVDRAKVLIMKQRGLSEPDAYALLRKFAMDRKTRIGLVAQQLIEAAAMLEGVEP
ncbi:MAG: ANTAR domain-containing protein [Planctomycetota bacterium]